MGGIVMAEDAARIPGGPPEAETRKLALKELSIQATEYFHEVGVLASSWKQPLVSAPAPGAIDSAPYRRLENVG
jgi:hypothetical protein